MKKLIIILSSLVALSSCCFLEYDSNDKSYRLQSFGENLVYKSATLTISTLNTLYFDEDVDIFREGFDTTISSRQTIRIIKDTLENKWTAVSDEEVVFSADVFFSGKSLGDYPEWELEMGGFYYEDETYRASISTKGKAKFFWTKNVSSTNVSFDLYQTGIYTVTTFCGTQTLDSYDVEYTGSSIYY